MKLAAALLLLSLPLLAAEPPPLAAAPAAARHRKKKAAEKRPWEALLESSRAALEASRRAGTSAASPATATVGVAVLSLPPAPGPAQLPPAPPPLAIPARSAPASGGIDLSSEPAPDLPSRVAQPLIAAPPVLAVEPAAAAEASPAAEPFVAAPPALAAAPALAARPALGASPAAFGTAGLATPSPDNLDFDLLGSAAAPEVAADPLLEQRLATRRTMLTLHQTVGLGLLGLMGATMLTGQLNYLDRFGGASTARYENPHKYLATATLVTFAGAGLLAYFTPVPMDRVSEGIDRATIHKAGMIGATGGMAAEGLFGILTASREGYANQSALARTHLVIGYFTLLCMSVGVGALVF